MSQGGPKSVKNRSQDEVNIEPKLENNFGAVLGAKLKQNGCQEASKNRLCCARICVLLSKLWNPPGTRRDSRQVGSENYQSYKTYD